MIQKTKKIIYIECKDIDKLDEDYDLYQESEEMIKEEEERDKLPKEPIW